ncbi:MAG: hypothetical protein AAGU11_10390 [Syntrophobacteraceae bacterium]
MAHNLRLLELFEGRKSPKKVLAISVILLLVLEIVIYLAVLGQSGLKSRIVITDSNGVKIYESAGAALTAYEKMVFESSHGPLRDFNTRVESELVPFPMRTWVLLAIGIPMGLILLVSFLVQVWLLLLNGGSKAEQEEGAAAADKNRLNSFLNASRHFSVLHVGFVIVLLMLTLWLVPSILGDVAKSCFVAVQEYQWFFLGVAVFAGGLLVWIIYLRYKLSRQMLQNQLEIEKYRVKKQILLAHDPAHKLLPGGAGHEEVQAQVLERGES